MKTTDMIREQRAYHEGYEQGKTDAAAWISVKDRLPEDGLDVLVYVKDGTPLQDILIDRRIGNHWELYDKPFVVTHWMPLPEPPKESDHAE